MLHQIEKTSTGYQCLKCRKSFKGKPRTDSCPGVFIYQDWRNIPQLLKTKSELKIKNLFPVGSPCGCIEEGRSYYYLYDINETIPYPIPIYEEKQRPKELKTVEELKDVNLVVDDQTPIKGLMYRGRGRIFEFRIIEPYYYKLYDPKDCRYEAQDNYITKSTLKTKYLLSEGWIKRIGKPGLILENPHYKHGSPMKLYSRFKVENFLAANAEEYAKWISKRDKLSILAQTNEGLQRKNELKRQFKEKCLRCKSGISTEQGFLCVIHPFDKPFPCPDFN